MIKQQKQSATLQTIALATVLLCSGSGLAFAEEAAAPAPTPPAKTNHWETTAAAGFTLTSGNSDTLLFTLTLDSIGKYEKNEIDFGASAGYGENTVNGVTSKTTEFVQGYAQYNRLFTDRFYGGLRVAGQYDEIAGIDYRFGISPVAGYYLIKNPKMSLAAEGGPSLVFEHLKGEEATAYWAARFGEKFEYKLTATTKIWQSLAYIPKVDQWEQNYLLNFEAGIDTAITKHWSLRVVFQDMYASEPAPDRKKNDIRLIAGTAYKF
jgi:putative salt-induced outer membrane protein YdiY